MTKTVYQFRYRLFRGDKCSRWIHSNRTSVSSDLSFTLNCAKRFKNNQESRGLYTKVKMQIVNNENSEVIEVN